MKLEKLGVITKAGKPLEWSSALHLEPKADNDLLDQPGLQWVTFDSGTIEETKVLVCLHILWFWCLLVDHTGMSQSSSIPILSNLLLCQNAA